MQQQKILITGAGGQIGTVLTQHLADKYGAENVIPTDLRQIDDEKYHWESLDVVDAVKLNALVQKHNITQIYHLAAILSAKGEADPIFTWNVNMNGLLNVLEAARQHKIQKVFYPSTIAVFGSSTPKVMTPQVTNLVPETVYGISKASGENWGHYYWKRYGLDVRSVRYPGIISHESLPGGGTTDYAVDIFYQALQHGSYECFLEENTELPMMYMPDTIKATIGLMEAPEEQIKQRASYNLTGMSFTPAQIAESIKKHIPGFSITYKPDFRQSIAASWPQSIDDSEARKDWGWQPSFDLDAMVGDMLTNLRKKIL